ncbi:hypothetical protein ACQEVB_37485 [Pseudonocardia sp. CA-107938]|uniref:hypothetical protein n=1 Tax=Pseudonocardia sp. CA-107938 TaxID=3240021 RepID=UPI003D93C54E
MLRFGRWLRANAEAFLALAIAITFGVLTVLDVIGPDDDIINAAILLVLALLVATLLRDRTTLGTALQTMNAVRLVSGSEVGPALAEARRDTDRWVHKGATGAHLRSVTLPACIELARQRRRPLRVQLEILDPTDTAACDEYAQFRSSLGSRNWTREEVQLEVYATLFAVFWHRSRFTFLSVDVGLSRTMSTLRVDLSANALVIGQEDPAGATLLVAAGRPHHAAYDRELVASFHQTRRVHLDAADELTFDDEPSTDDVRRLFRLLGIDLPATFSERDIVRIVQLAREVRP